MTFNRRLTDGEMATIQRETSDPTATIVKFYDVALAPSTFDEQETIQPTEFKLPEDQWGQICNWLREGQDNADNAFAACWSWMNSGPSASC